MIPANGPVADRGGVMNGGFARTVLSARALPALLAVLPLFMDHALAEEEDLRGMASPTCELPGLTVLQTSVPVSGERFSGGKALAVRMQLEGVEHQNEAHFILFRGSAHHYIVSLLTPEKAVSPDIYQSNTSAMSQLTKTLQPR